MSMKGPIEIEQSSSPWLTLTFHHDMKVKQMEWIRIELKNLIKISKIRKSMSLPIPLVMKIIIIFD
jgi:hypothetical protein